MVVLICNLQKILYFANFWFWDNCTVIRNTIERPSTQFSPLVISFTPGNILYDQEMVITPSTKLSFHYFYTHHVCLESQPFWSPCRCEWLLLQGTDRKFPAHGSLLVPSYSTSHSTPLTATLQCVVMTLSFQSDDCVDLLSSIVLRLAVSMWQDSLESLQDYHVY